MASEAGPPNDESAGESDDQRASRAFGRYAGIGLQFAVSVLVCLYAGQWLDRRLNSAPWGVLIGVLVGASAAFYSMYRRLMADLERDEREKRTRRDREPRARDDRNGGGGS